MFLGLDDAVLEREKESHYLPDDLYYFVTINKWNESFFKKIKTNDSTKTFKICYLKTQ